MVSLAEVPVKSCDGGEVQRSGIYERFSSFAEPHEIPVLRPPLCREDIFADVHNLDHCIKYLNQSLITFGFPSGLNLYSSDPVRLIEIRSSYLQDFLNARQCVCSGISQASRHCIIEETRRFWGCSCVLNIDLVLIQVSIAKTCNCIYAMIQQRQRDIKHRETANDTRQRFARGQRYLFLNRH